MRSAKRQAEIRGFVGHRDAIAKALDPVAFERRYLIGAAIEFREHLLARRLAARRKATTAIHALADRGWRPPPPKGVDHP